MAHNDQVKEPPERDDYIASEIVKICKCGVMIYKSALSGITQNARDNTIHVCKRTTQDRMERERCRQYSAAITEIESREKP